MLEAALSLELGFSFLFLLPSIAIGFVLWSEQALKKPPK